jgi:hypothetical protein
LEGFLELSRILLKPLKSVYSATAVGGFRLWPAFLLREVEPFVASFKGL